MYRKRRVLEYSDSLLDELEQTKREFIMPYAKRARYTPTYRRKSYKKPTAAFQRQTAGRSYGSNKTLDFPLSALVSVPRSAVDRRELKQSTTNPIPAATAGSATGSVWNYVGQIAAGDNNDQREGRAIKIVSLHVSLMVYRTSVPANANIDVHRLVVGVWKPDDSSSFLPSQLLQAGSNALITAGYGSAFTPQFTILYDAIVTEPNAVPTGGNMWHVYHAKIPVNLIQTYTASAGTDACNNQLWVMWINQAGGSTLGQVTCNTKFIDV